VGSAQGAGQNTLFFPLRIHAQEAQQIQGAMDQALREALAHTDFTLLSRTEAADLLVASTTWPPPLDKLTQALEQHGKDYVALGSITVIGGRLSVDMQVIDLLEPKKPYSLYREARTQEEVPLILQNMVTDILGSTNRSLVIGSIAPANNQRIDSGAILRQIASKPGDLYSPDSLRRDLKAVFALGYFDNVEIKVQDSAKGKEVLFHVYEKPLLRKLTFTGRDKLDEKDVRDAAALRTHTILNLTELHNAVKRIEEFYKSKGYYAATSRFAIQPAGEHEVDVVFTISEGSKMSIAEVRFVGNSSFDHSKLKAVIQTSSRSWLSWLTDAGTLKQDVLGQDADRLVAFYNNEGFIEAKVAPAEVEVQQNRLFVSFTIQEGPRYRVGSVDIEGDLIQGKEEMLALLKITKERFMNRKVLHEDVLKLTDLYAEKGYAFTDVDPRVRKSSADEPVMDITFVIDRGDLVRFNRVNIQGNTRTRDNVIRRDLAVEEGGIYNSKAVRDSVRNLQRLGFFEDVTVTPHPTLSEDRMDVLVNLKERPTGQFSIGAGYSSSDKLMFMGEISEDNFLGTGNRLALSANLSSVTTRFNLSYTDPRVFDSRVSAGLDAFNWSRKYTNYTKASKGGGLRLGHHLIEEWRIYYGYSWTDTTLEDIAPDASDYILESAKINITSAVRVSLVRDSRDRFFNTSSGSRHSVSVQHAGGFLGGEAQYTKLEGSTDWYYPLPLSTVLRGRLSAGKAFENEEGKLPVYDNFYLGGMNSIRGFKSSTISPINPNNDEKYGGDKMWFANIELYFPLLTDAGLRGLVFSDFGNVYAQDDSWDFGNIKKSAGIGINWLSPVGPLRLVWGYNLDSQKGDEDARWDFAMGGSF
jgi:outer membrane protein insertion porin family